MQSVSEVKVCVASHTCKARRFHKKLTCTMRREVEVKYFGGIVITFYIPAEVTISQIPL